MGATLTGVALYRARGYVSLEHLDIPLKNGESLPIVRMEKRQGEDVALTDVIDQSHPAFCR